MKLNFNKKNPLNFQLSHYQHIHFHKDRKIFRVEIILNKSHLIILLSRMLSYK